MQKTFKPNTHCRRDSTIELRRIVVCIGHKAYLCHRNALQSAHMSETAVKYSRRYEDRFMNMIFRALTVFQGCTLH